MEEFSGWELILMTGSNEEYSSLNIFLSFPFFFFFFGEFSYALNFGQLTIFFGGRRFLNWYDNRGDIFSKFWRDISNFFIYIFFFFLGETLKYLAPWNFLFYAWKTFNFQLS